MAEAQRKQSGIRNATASYSSSPTTQKRRAIDTSDTSRRRRYQSTTSYNSTSNSRIDYPTTSDLANKKYNGIPTAAVGTANDPTTRRQSGIQNPVVSYAPPANDNRPIQSSAEKKEKDSRSTERSSYNTGLRPSPQPRARRKKRGLKKLATTGYKLAARVSLVGLYGWVGFLWMLQTIFAVLFWIALGTQISIEQFTQNGLLGSITEFGLAYTGLDWAFDLLFWLALVINVVLVLVQTISILLYTKALGMHPLGGRGHVLKVSTAFLAIISSIIGIGFIPLFWLWVFSISLYPR